MRFSAITPTVSQKITRNMAQEAAFNARFLDPVAKSVTFQTHNAEIFKRQLSTLDYGSRREEAKNLVAGMTALAEENTTHLPQITEGRFTAGVLHKYFQGSPLPDKRVQPLYNRMENGLQIAKETIIPNAETFQAKSHLYQDNLAQAIEETTARLNSKKA